MVVLKPMYEHGWLWYCGIPRLLYTELNQIWTDTSSQRPGQVVTDEGTQHHNGVNRRRGGPDARFVEPTSSGGVSGIQARSDERVTRISGHIAAIPGAHCVPAVCVICRRAVGPRVVKPV